MLLTIKRSFFVDHCSLVEDPDTIPSYEKAGIEADAMEDSAFALPSTFADENGLDRRGDELTNLLARFEEVHRKLRTHAEGQPQEDRKSVV